jgi:hypothetical protein
VGNKIEKVHRRNQNDKPKSKLFKLLVRKENVANERNVKFIGVCLISNTRNIRLQQIFILTTNKH